MGKSYFSVDVSKLLVDATKLACVNGHDTMGLEYLLLILARDNMGPLQSALFENHYSFIVLQELLLQFRPVRNVVLTHQQLTRTDYLKRALNEADVVRRRMHQPLIEVDHVVIGLLKTRSVLSDALLAQAGITEERRQGILAAVEAAAEVNALDALFEASPSTL